MPKTTTKQVEIEIIHLKKGEFTAWIVGETAFFANRMASKAKRELLLPRGTMNRAQRAVKLKHAPYAEYRDSAYLRRGGGDTRIMMVASGIKKGIANAALRMPSGVAKSEINQLVVAPEEYIPIWGVPRLDMSVVRQAGISRTPDIRTRVRIDRWAARVRLQWLEPMLSASKVLLLASAAGLLSGLGDWRIEKGGPFGSYRVVEPDDKELADIIAGGGYLAQDEALKTPECANGESEDLLEWYLEELARRGLKPDDQEPEDIEIVEETNAMYFGAGQETIEAPANGVDRLAEQEEEHA